MEGDAAPSAEEMARMPRWNITPETLNMLEDVFRAQPFPPIMMREKLAKNLDVTPRQVQIWFQNRRQRARHSKYKPQAPRLVDSEGFVYGQPASTLTWGSSPAYVQCIDPHYPSDGGFSAQQTYDGQYGQMGAMQQRGMPMAIPAGSPAYSGMGSGMLLAQMPMSAHYVGGQYSLPQDGPSSNVGMPRGSSSGQNMPPQNGTMISPGASPYPSPALEQRFLQQMQPPQPHMQQPQPHMQQQPQPHMQQQPQPHMQQQPQPHMQQPQPQPHMQQPHMQMQQQMQPHMQMQPQMQPQHMQMQQQMQPQQHVHTQGQPQQDGQEQVQTGPHPCGASPAQPLSSPLFHARMCDGSGAPVPPSPHGTGGLHASLASMGLASPAASPYEAHRFGSAAGGWCNSSPLFSSIHVQHQSPQPCSQGSGSGQLAQRCGRAVTLQLPSQQMGCRPLHNVEPSPTQQHRGSLLCPPSGQPESSSFGGGGVCVSVPLNSSLQVPFLQNNLNPNLNQYTPLFCNYSLQAAAQVPRMHQSVPSAQLVGMQQPHAPLMQSQMQQPPQQPMQMSQHVPMQQQMQPPQMHMMHQPPAQMHFQQMPQMQPQQMQPHQAHPHMQQQPMQHMQQMQQHPSHQATPPPSSCHPSSGLSAESSEKAAHADSGARADGNGGSRSASDERDPNDAWAAASLLEVHAQAPKKRTVPELSAEAEILSRYTAAEALASAGARKHAPPAQDTEAEGNDYVSPPLNERTLPAHSAQSLKNQADTRGEGMPAASARAA